MSLQETFVNSMVCSISTGMVLKWIPVHKINLHGGNAHNGIPRGKENNIQNLHINADIHIRKL